MRPTECPFCGAERPTPSPGSPATLLANAARAVVDSHRRSDWRNIARGIWLRADKCPAFIRNRAKGR